MPKEPQLSIANVPLQASNGGGDGFIQLGTSDQVYNHGYAVLQLGDPATASATYYEVPGDGSSAQSTEVWRENLCRAEPSALA